MPFDLFLSGFRSSLRPLELVCLVFFPFWFLCVVFMLLFLVFATSSFCWQHHGWWYYITIECSPIPSSIVFTPYQPKMNWLNGNDSGYNFSLSLFLSGSFTQINEKFVYYIFIWLHRNLRLFFNLKWEPFNFRSNLY